MPEVTELKFLTRPEAAERYRVGLRTIDRWIREGRLPKIQIGSRCIRLPQQQCDAALMRLWSMKRRNRALFFHEILRPFF